MDGSGVAASDYCFSRKWFAERLDQRRSQVERRAAVSGRAQRRRTVLPLARSGARPGPLARKAMADTAIRAPFPASSPTARQRRRLRHPRRPCRDGRARDPMRVELTVPEHPSRSSRSAAGPSHGRCLSGRNIRAGPFRLTTLRTDQRALTVEAIAANADAPSSRALRHRVNQQPAATPASSSHRGRWKPSRHQPRLCVKAGTARTDRHARRNRRQEVEITSGSRQGRHRASEPRTAADAPSSARGSSLLFPTSRSDPSFSEIHHAVVSLDSVRRPVLRACSSSRSPSSAHSRSRSRLDRFPKVDFPTVS